jgi:hypothetical protein
LILYCDEDVGTKVPRALKLVGLRVISAVSKGATSEPDIQWLTRVGKKGWLGLSSNKNILNVPEENDAIISNKVGIVFLTSGNMHPKDKLLLLLRKWEWMEMIDSTENKPFAFYLSPAGKTRKAL